MATVRVGGEEIFYVERGAGPVVVLLHGAGGTWHYWGLQVRALAARGYRAIAPDLPGHGRSSGAPRVVIAEYGQIVRDFLRALALEEVTLVGHS
ncbi:MAG: alpha/beta fold hydrolase, partial [Ardenticatenaceae bacterium]